MALLAFETQKALENISRGLTRARLLRGDSQHLAAERVGVSVATYRRLESGDPEKVGAVAAASLLQALVVYGYERDVLNLGDFARDARALEITGRILPKYGRNRSAKGTK